MKKIIFSFLVLFIVAMTPLFATKASAGIAVAVVPLFDLQISAIDKVLNTDKTQFTFKTVSPQDSSSIDHWAVRIWCKDPATSILVNGSVENSCEKTVPLGKMANKNFSLSFVNPTQKHNGFSFKLKAYDKNGNWLHSEKRVFLWK